MSGATSAIPRWEFPLEIAPDFQRGKRAEALAGLAAGSTQEEYKLKTMPRIEIGVFVRETEQRVAATWGRGAAPCEDVCSFVGWRRSSESSRQRLPTIASLPKPSYDRRCWRDVCNISVPHCGTA